MCSCRACFCSESWPLYSCCLHAVSEKWKPWKVLWKLLLLEGSQGSRNDLLPCMHQHVNTDSLFLYFSVTLKSTSLWTFWHGPLLILFQGLINVDYESEVDDDMIYIFRKGEVSTDLLFLLWIDKLKSSSSIDAQFIFDHRGVLAKFSFQHSL